MVPVSIRSTPPAAGGRAIQRAPATRSEWPWPISATSPASSRVRAAVSTRSSRSPTSSAVSPAGQPSRHRYQSGRVRRISGVVMPSYSP